MAAAAMTSEGGKTVADLWIKTEIDPPQRVWVRLRNVSSDR